MAESPNYKHDCTACRFIGNVESLDFYYCPATAFGSYILRHSDQEENYESHPLLPNHKHIDELKRKHVKHILAGKYNTDVAAKLNVDAMDVHKWKMGFLPNARHFELIIKHYA